MNKFIYLALSISIISSQVEICMEPLFKSYVPKSSQYGAISTSKPLNNMFSPADPEFTKTLNLLSKGKYYCIGNEKKQLNPKVLPAEIWELIWGHLTRKDKLNLCLMSNSFVHIQPYIQLEVCHQALLKTEYYYSTYDAINSFYIYIKKICDIHENTNTTNIKTLSNLILENNKAKVQQLINRQEPSVKNKRHYVNTEAYKKLKYLKETFNEPDTCNVFCTECQDECKDEWHDTMHGCSRCAEICCLCCCCPCIILLECIIQ